MCWYFLVSEFTVDVQKSQWTKTKSDIDNLWNWVTLLARSFLAFWENPESDNQIKIKSCFWHYISHLSVISFVNISLWDSEWRRNLDSNTTKVRPRGLIRPLFIMMWLKLRWRLSEFCTLREIKRNGGHVSPHIQPFSVWIMTQTITWWLLHNTFSKHWFDSILRSYYSKLFPFVCLILYAYITSRLKHSSLLSLYFCFIFTKNRWTTISAIVIKKVQQMIKGNLLYWLLYIYNNTV